MKKLAIVVGLIFAACLFGVIWYKLVRETPEQLAARRNLETLDQIVAAWESYEAMPRDELLDEKPFRVFAAELNEIDLVDADPEVKAIHARYVKFTADAPGLIKQFKSPPKEAPDNRALQQQAATEWVLDTRNMGIQLEVLLRGVDDEIGRLRAKYLRQRKR